MCRNFMGGVFLGIVFLVRIRKLREMFLLSICVVWSCLVENI